MVWNEKHNMCGPEKVFLFVGTPVIRIQMGSYLEPSTIHESFIDSYFLDFSPPMMH